MESVRPRSSWYQSVHAFPAESIVGRHLAKLTRHHGGWKLLRDEATGEPVLSSAPVAAFVGASNCPYMLYGSLARIADDNDEVTVMFGNISPLARWTTKACANLDAVLDPTL